MTHSNSEIDRFFDCLHRDLDHLRQRGDNEAMRHQLIIHPLLTSPMVLGWVGPELLCEQNVNVSEQVQESYYWKGAVPKKRRPDILVVPLGYEHPVAVIEQKKRQNNLTTLRNYAGQLNEYQYLHHTVWGILTDGEKWIIKRNHEIYQELDSLHEVRKYLADLRNCLGRQSMMNRLEKYGTTDLIIVNPSPQIVIVASLEQFRPILDLRTFIQTPSKAVSDLVIYLSHNTPSFKAILDGEDDSVRETLSFVVGEFLHDKWASTICLTSQALDMFSNLGENIEYDHEIYREIASMWATAYPLMVNFIESEVVNDTITAKKLIDLFNSIGIKPDDFINYVSLHVRLLELKESKGTVELVKWMFPNSPFA